MFALPVVESRPEGRVMPKQKRGNRKRAAILRELYRRELAHEPSPTISDLAPILARLNKDGSVPGDKTVYYHLVVLRGEGLVTWVPLAARTLQLTPEGRGRVTKIGT